MKYLVIVFLALLGFYGQSQDLSTEMEKALKLHESAKDFEGELKAAEAFKTLSDTNEKDWLAAYWTSFVFSQVANATKADKRQYLDLAVDYFDRTEANLLQPSKEDKSILLSLKALLTGLYSQYYYINGNIEKGGEFSKINSQAINDGLLSNSENPLLYVLLGTNYIGQSFRSKPQPDMPKMITGKLLLEQAKTRYKSMPSENKLYPDRWNEPWIDFWLNRLKKG